MTKEKIKERMEEVLNEQFPKGECKERRHALVLYAESINALEQREKEILEILKNADYGSYIITEGNAGAVFDIDNFIKKEIEPKIKGENK